MPGGEGEVGEQGGGFVFTRRFPRFAVRLVAMRGGFGRMDDIMLEYLRICLCLACVCFIFGMLG